MSDPTYRVWIDLQRLQRRLDSQRQAGENTLPVESWLHSHGFKKSFERGYWLARSTILALLNPDEIHQRECVLGDAADQNHEAPPHCAADRRDVLIVEDDPGMRYVINRVLSEKGLSSIFASTLAEGVSLLETHPKWLVLDLRLPDGNGVELLRRVREQAMPTRVIVTTGHCDLLDEPPAHVPDAVFVKPYDAARLANQIATS